MYSTTEKCAAFLIIILIFYQILLSLTQSTADVPEGAIRLEGGRVDGSGNVLVFHAGQWGYVCDDGWDIRAATVICTSLGYPKALRHTGYAFFGAPTADNVWLDNIRCYGDEKSILECQHNGWGIHDCATQEAAGVFCAPRRQPDPPKPTTTSAPTTAAPIPTLRAQRQIVRNNDASSGASGFSKATEASQTAAEKQNATVLMDYDLRIQGGRTNTEGRVEVFYMGKWGVICGHNWGILEATVVCRQLGLGYASSALQGNYFGGDFMDKVLAEVKCEGHEARLSECFNSYHTPNTVCPQQKYIASVVCTEKLADLVPNATLLELTTYLQDQPMYYMQCAMEEGCASSSAFAIKKKQRDWHIQSRRLLRFSSSTQNVGTADFRPFLIKEDWEWHLCHMHFHSMEVFAHYDLLDDHGNRVAEGHKASFCLEDVECIPGVDKRYVCKGYGDQGISVGCADNYLHDIDCQWIDITDVKPGKYKFRVHINPENKVAEISFDNNAATCDLDYTGTSVTVTNCELGRVRSTRRP